MNARIETAIAELRNSIAITNEKILRANELRSNASASARVLAEAEEELKLAQFNLEQETDLLRAEQVALGSAGVMTAKSADERAKQLEMYLRDYAQKNAEYWHMVEAQKIAESRIVPLKLALAEARTALEMIRQQIELAPSVLNAQTEILRAIQAEERAAETARLATKEAMTGNK